MISATDLGGNERPQELDSVEDHVLLDLLSHLLVEAPQQHGAYHDSDLHAQSGQEPGALQADIGCPHHQCVPRAVVQ